MSCSGTRLYFEIIERLADFVDKRWFDFDNEVGQITLHNPNHSIFIKTCYNEDSFIRCDGKKTIIKTVDDVINFMRGITET